MGISLREPAFLILAALAEQPLHGYGLIAAVERMSEGNVTLRPGTLYGALDRLGDDGLIELDREEVVDSRLRRYYRLSDQGAAALGAETERLRRNVEAATAGLRARERAARARDRAARALPTVTFAPGSAGPVAGGAA